MAQRAKKLRSLISNTKKTTDQAQKAFLKAEDRLAELEDREARREATKSPADERAPQPR